MKANEVGSNSFKKVKTFKYLGPLFTNQYYIHEKIKFTPKAGNTSYYSV